MTKTNSSNALRYTRDQDFSRWYQEVIREADLSEGGGARGSIIFKPNGFALWEAIQQAIDGLLKASQHKNVYFPLLIPLSLLQKEADHIDGFAKECAVVTHHRLVCEEGKLLPDPDSRLHEPLVIRPTSEAVIGEAFSRWISAQKDLPILINQWCNVVRWEMRPRQFLRTSEFLWQEGHTAHARQDEAEAEARFIIELYQDFVTNVLAMPVVVGKKSRDETFPGAEYTWTIEAMMQDGKALQSGTSHFLGQNFSRAYGISYKHQHSEQFVWTSSWGVSTRLIGGMIMTHSDDNGLVLPPAIAPIQLRILLVEEAVHSDGEIYRYASHIAETLIADLTAFGKPIRYEIIFAGLRPGSAFWAAVKEGIPLIVQIGRREIEQGGLSLTVRSDPELKKASCSAQSLALELPDMLHSMQTTLLHRARAYRESRTVYLYTSQDIDTAFHTNAADWVICPFDADSEALPIVQEMLLKHHISIRCLQSLEEKNDAGKKARCALSDNIATHFAVLAKSY